MGLSLVAAITAADEIDTLLAALARPAPSAVAFTEIRFSPLLDEPLVVSGTLEYAGPGLLARTVTTPYTERTEISGDEVLISREGGRARRFSLKRAPELLGLLTSFSAVLGADAALLRRSFDPGLMADGISGRWELTLVPRDERMRARIGTVSITGAGDAPECIVMREGASGMSAILIGEATTGGKLLTTKAAIEARCFTAR